MAHPQHSLIRPCSLWWAPSSMYTPEDENSEPPEPPSLISFCHPGYHNEAQILFRLPSFDKTADNIPGIHHGVALTACMIIANNTPGHLSVSPNPVIAIAEINLPWDYILTYHTYYFHPSPGNLTSDPSNGSSGTALPYSICPSFSHWVFPHNNLPGAWLPDPLAHSAAVGRAVAPSNMTSAVLSRHRSCRITDSQACLNNAHVVPKDEMAWFRVNKMNSYNLNQKLGGKDLINDVRNGIALRADLNGLSFDKHQLVIVPKENKFTIHFLEDAYDLVPLYHNREILPIPNVSREFLYARFAWAIFPKISLFLFGLPVRLTIYTTVSGQRIPESKYIDWNQHLQSERSSTSSTSSKRKRQGTEEPLQDRGSGGDICAWDNDVITTNQENPIDLPDKNESPMRTTDYNESGIYDKPGAYTSVTPPSSPSWNHPVTPESTPRSLADYFNPSTETLARQEEKFKEDMNFAAYAFPEMVEGYEESVGNRVWEEVTWYPGVERVEKMKSGLRKNRGWVEVLAGRTKRRRVWNEVEDMAV